MDHDDTEQAPENVIFTSHFIPQTATETGDFYDDLMVKYFDSRSAELCENTRSDLDSDLILKQLISTPVSRNDQLKFKLNLYYEELSHHYELCHEEIHQLMVQFASIHADILRSIDKI